MTTLTVTAKGQITLKRQLLTHLGVGPGDKLNVTALPDGRIEVASERPQRAISEIFGLLKSEARPALTIDAINDIIAGGWAGER